MFDPQPHLIQLPRKVKDKATGHYTTVYDDYLEVKWRLCWFRDRYPHGVIETEEICVDLERGYACYKTTVEDGQGGKATGFGTETAAEFADYCERAETRALGRALAALGIGTQFVGQDLTEGEHVADAPVRPLAATNGHAPKRYGDIHGPGMPSNPDPPGEGAVRLTPDQARDLKKLAHAAFGYVEGSRRLRQDLGFEPEESLTLRHLAAHVSVAQYQTLMDAYGQVLRQAVEADLPDFPPPAANGQPEPTPDERLRWGALSRRSLTVGLSATTWEALRQGDYAAAERVIVALEGPGHP
jgi:hypothetical protein